jgi:REP element-mobilizing transposase RayT
MPRQARLGAPGTLHQVMGRGIERTKVFRAREDREDFQARWGELCKAAAVRVYVWALMDNHFHLLAKSGNQSFSQSMRRLLIGYVINFNRRPKRYGHLFQSHLFQNWYKSIICRVVYAPDGLRRGNHAQKSGWASGLTTASARAGNSAALHGQPVMRVVGRIQNSLYNL